MERLPELEAQLIQLMMYYHRELQQQGIQDTKQYLATQLPKWIHFSEQQLQFIQSELDMEKWSETLEHVLVLLQSIHPIQPEEKEHLTLSVQILQQFQKIIKGSEEK